MLKIAKKGQRNFARVITLPRNILWFIIHSVKSQKSQRPGSSLANCEMSTVSILPSLSKRFVLEGIPTPLKSMEITLAKERVVAYVRREGEGGDEIQIVYGKYK